MLINFLNDLWAALVDNAVLIAFGVWAASMLLIASTVPEHDETSENGDQDHDNA